MPREHISDAMVAYVDTLPATINPVQGMWLTMGGAVTAVADFLAKLQIRLGNAADGHGAMLEQFQVSYAEALAAHQAAAATPVRPEPVEGPALAI
jgi:hypothetical protein